MELDVDKLQPAQSRKRPPEDELAGEQRLAKRFHLLNLENARQLYVPTEPRLPVRRQRANAVSDHMRVEDSKHHVYVHDLDAELESTDSEAEEKLVFLPDIEKRLANLPKSVLTNDSAPKGNEVVLYSVPESLSVPREQDNVRKAIIESRNRAREERTGSTGDARELQSSEFLSSSCTAGEPTKLSTVPVTYDDTMEMEVD